MTKAIWRVQCDIAGDDPVWEVFIGDVVEGRTRMDASDPYRIKTSELTSLADLTDIVALDAIVAARPPGPPFPIYQHQPSEE
ncbi:MAG TPA: hypothetical protein VNQ99_14935 [Xanthobacteraceae bacterium]|nr:hypothetical protein [Xanthobacteraceae bacterium]